MNTRIETTRSLPWTQPIAGETVTFRLMTPEDGRMIQRFSRGLGNDDITFLRMDIREPEVIHEWLENVRHGRTITLLAAASTGDILGYASLHRNALNWSSHLGELRMLVLQTYRGKGLGTRLLNEIFEIARRRDLSRIVVHLPTNQPHTRAMLEHLNFKVNALLPEWIQAQDGTKHDLHIMSHEVEQ